MPRLARMIQLLLLISALVSAAAAQAGGVYIDNQDDTITDRKHDLMWQRADDGVERSWKEAITYCESLELAGHEDWMLPTAAQLEMLIDTAYSPTIDPLFSVKASYYWSVTESKDKPNSAEYVNFFYGNTYTYSKDNPYLVICVREAKAIAGKGLAAVFTGEQMAGKPLTISFTPTVTGGVEPYFYDWDFGDGVTASAKAPTHEFATDGQYKVLLTVSDNNGAIAVASQVITLPLAALPAVPAVGQTQGAKPAGALPETVPASETAASKGADQAVIPADILREKMAATPPPAPETAPPAATEKGPVTSETGAPPLPGAAGTQTASPAPGVMEVEASGQGEPYRAGAFGHGLLSYAFANAMTRDGDGNKDGSLTASELQAYLDQAIKSLSKGQQSPRISRDGDDFMICAAPPGSTYVLGIGIGHDLAGVALVASQDAEWVRKAVEEKCPDTRTMMLAGDHANRSDILQALVKLGSMVTAADNLLVYIGAANGRDNGRLNWYVNDTSKELPWFTGIYHDDLLQFLKRMPAAHLLVMGEKH